MIKQKRNNTRGDNRHRRRIELNFRVRPSWAARANSQRTKMPLAPILSISNVPNEVLNAIDELAASQDRSRSSFIRRELKRVVTEYRTKTA
jgi:hypothetical protein